MYSLISSLGAIFNTAGYAVSSNGYNMVETWFPKIVTLGMNGLWPVDIFYLVICGYGYFFIPHIIIYLIIVKLIGRIFWGKRRVCNICEKPIPFWYRIPILGYHFSKTYCCVSFGLFIIEVLVAMGICAMSGTIFETVRDFVQTV